MQQVAAWLEGCPLGFPAIPVSGPGASDAGTFAFPDPPVHRHDGGVCPAGGGTNRGDNQDPFALIVGCPMLVPEAKIDGCISHVRLGVCMKLNSARITAYATVAIAALAVVAAVLGGLQYRSMQGQTERNA